MYTLTRVQYSDCSVSFFSEFLVTMFNMYPSVTHPVVHQNLSGNKVKTLRGAPILHRGDLKKCLGLLNCLNKFFKLQVCLETFCALRAAPRNFSVVFHHAKGGVREAPQLVPGKS